jgi:hypothetical protein
MRAAYKTCLKERQRWRRANKLTKGTARFNVVGPYVETDGRLMVGCLQEGLTRAQAEHARSLRHNALSRNEYLVGYRSELAEEMARATRVVPAGACPAPRAVGHEFDLTWAGTPSDMFEPGSSRRARTLPELSGMRRRR